MNMSVVDELGGETATLLPWGVVPLTGTDLQVFLQGTDLDTAITTVGVEVRRMIGNHVLTAEFVLDRGERILYVLNIEREERPSTRRHG